MSGHGVSCMMLWTYLRLEEVVVVCPQSTGQGQHRAQDEEKRMVACQEHLLLKVADSHAVDVLKDRPKRKSSSFVQLMEVQ